MIGEWAFRITAYADALLQGLDELTGWPERVTTMQRNWIGRSDGAEVAFTVAGTGERIKVFTTRLDTIFGCTYVVLAPEHPLVASIVTPAQRAPVQSFVDRMLHTDRAERTDEKAAKEGVFTGAPRSEPVHRSAAPGLDRELRPRRLRHRRGDERARPRPARLRVRPQVRAAGES